MAMAFIRLSVLALPVGAEIVGSCSASINGVDVRSKVTAQVADVRSQATTTAGDGGEVLDEARAAAAEEAAEIAADVEAKAAKVKRAAKSAASE